MIRFSLLFEKLKSKKRRWIEKRDALLSSPEPQIDLSLRANGNAYIQRNGEANAIKNRIDNSSSSVIGIGGVRGAGKSSLALRVLDDCKAQGYFVVIIPSPSAYEPKEFLLTIYQNITENLRLQLLLKFKQQESFESQSQKELSKIIKTNRLVFTWVVFIILIISIACLNTVHRQTNRQFLSAEIDSLNARMDSLNYFNLRHFSHDTLSYNGLKANWLRNLQHADSNRLAKLTKDLAAYDKTSGFADNFYIYPGLESISSSIFYVGIVCLIIITVYYFSTAFLKKMNNRITRLKNFPKESALLKQTVAKLEWLTYQAKLSSNTDWNIPVSGFSAKFTKGQQLEARPLSMPGITSDFNLFIKDMTQVYPKVVICIDELDKIANENELEGLLKGIKGIIGQKDTYFLLTVSEDAISKFSTRFRKDRDLLESSFEEIYLLDRVDLDLAKQIILAGQYTSFKDDLGTSLSVLIVWFFANGIPREIKRNLIVLNRVNVTLTSIKKYEVWSALLFYSIDALYSWILVNKSEETAVFGFLKCLDFTQKTVPTVPFHFQQGVDWFHSLLSYFQEFFPIRAAGSHDEPFSSTIYERALFENILMCCSFLLLTLDEDQVITTGKRLQRIFVLLSYNYLYAVNELTKLLTSLQIGHTIFDARKTITPIELSVASELSGDL